MRYLLFFLPLVFFFVSCGDKPSKSEYDQLKADLDSCKKENEANKVVIADLKITPQRRLADARLLFDHSNFADAKYAFELIINRYPNTEEAKIASKYCNGSMGNGVPFSQQCRFIS
jgi:hypothetical protein